MLEGIGLTLRRGGRVVLEGAAFTARAGGLTAILGPNGSGKSTLLAALAGGQVAAGMVRLNGRPAATIPPAELATLRAVLPQAVALSLAFRVREVVGLGLIAGCPGTETEDLPERALARVGLAGFGPRRFHELSGGEQARVQLARVLVQVWTPVLDGQPRWLLLDEPVAALDIAHQLQVMAVARDYARAGGGVVAVLHDLNLAAMFADRVALLQGGRIAAFGPPEDVLDDAHLAAAYGVPLRVNTAPSAGRWVLPQSALPVCPRAHSSVPGMQRQT